MKKLSELYNCNFDIPIKDIKINSKEVEKYDLFVCTKGVNTDRHDFIDEAIKNGASALVVEKEENYKVPFIKVEDTNKELGYLSTRFYDDSLKKIKLIGITGTDGKTTTASIIRNMLGNNNCGYIGTNGVYCKNERLKENNTTPEINKTYKYLNHFVQENLEYTTMEISSEALYRNRTNTLNLDVAIITNITEDHLNIHKTLENYIESKEKILSLIKKDGVLILNSDDKYFKRILSKAKVRVLTFGTNAKSDLIIKTIKENDDSTSFTIVYKDKSYEVKSPLIGKFNVYNVCASILTLIYFGYKIDDAIDKVKEVIKIDGRCEILGFRTKYKIVLDYAHTENALKNILTYLNKIKKRRIITITGAAGGRYHEKRSKIGKIVLSMSDLVIFTMDDPRYESVEEIIDEMVSTSSLKNYVRIIDREQAIMYALKNAKKDDIILIAGKGKDMYMAIKDKYIPYSDYQVVEKYINSVNKSK